MANPNRTQIPIRIWSIALVCYWGLLFVGTHIPTTAIHLPGRAIDKILHVIGFAGLSALIALNWQLAGGQLKLRHYLAVWIAVALYGAADEILQMPVGRHASPWDWGADLVGALLGIVLFHLLRPWIVARLTQPR